MAMALASVNVKKCDTACKMTNKAVVKALEKVGALMMCRGRGSIYRAC